MKSVEYLIREDGKYLAYLQLEKSNIYNWDGEYRSEQEFLETYKDFERILIEDN